jgi:hypothetical protein
MISSLINDRFQSEYPCYNISLIFYSHYYTPWKKKNRDIVFREIINTVETKHISSKGVFCSGVYYTRESTYKDCYKRQVNEGRFVSPSPSNEGRTSTQTAIAVLFLSPFLFSLHPCIKKTVRYWKYLNSLGLFLFLFPPKVRFLRRSTDPKKTVLDNKF